MRAVVIVLVCVVAALNVPQHSIASTRAMAQCNLPEIYGRYWTPSDNPYSGFRYRVIETFEGLKILQQGVQEEGSRLAQEVSFEMYDLTMNEQSCSLSWQFSRKHFGAVDGILRLDGDHMVAENYYRERGKKYVVPLTELAPMGDSQTMQFYSSLAMRVDSGINKLTGVEIMLVPFQGVFHRVILQLATPEITGVYLGRIERDRLLTVEFRANGKQYRFTAERAQDQNKLNGNLADHSDSAVLSGLELTKGPSFWDTHDWEDFAKQSPESEGTGEAAKPSPEDAQSPTP
ncbi:MAG: hypothetical protein KDH09_16550 [Chrysiogenetes bacterium]|nr:hypothetical protein [Chrysiogenetes bacterium]